VLEAKYELKDKLGSGGFGSVYRARHVALDTFVAIKVLHSHLLDNEATRVRFAREGVSACRVRHPNAVAVLDAGTTDQGAPYLVMELLEGPSLLEELVRETVLRVGRVADIAVPVCEVLQTAHGAGVIHRDIKPANILLARTPQGEVVKVLDFGVAKLVDEVLDTPVTAGDQVIGTPHYMAPERLLGRATDAASDVYSLGAMLYQMLSGNLPFEAAGATPLAQALRQLRDKPTALDDVRPDLPAELADAVMRCLAADAAARPALHELAETLRHVGAEHVEHVWPPELRDGPAHAPPADSTSGTVQRSEAQPTTRGIDRAAVHVAEPDGQARGNAPHGRGGRS
jgi:serine/threonine protein kinase